MVSFSVCSIVFGKRLLEQDGLFLGSGCIPRYMFFHLAIILFFNFLHTLMQVYCLIFSGRLGVSVISVYYSITCEWLLPSG